VTRDSFLKNVRQAAEMGRAYRVHLHEVPPDTRYVGASSADGMAAAAREIEAVGGVAHRVPTDEQACQTILALLQQYAARRVLGWRHPVLTELRLPAQVAQQSIEWLDLERLAELPVAERRQRALAADVGITSADWLIAETGSLVLRARPGQERWASLLPPVHIAVIRRYQIIPDLIDVFQALRDQGLDQLTSHITLVTGPSKTGDIELQLTTGVHGPGHWHVVLIG
jgi:L-lactate dehydrogenase complex protein LldG